jgi:hypothetical protein
MVISIRDIDCMKYRKNAYEYLKLLGLHTFLGIYLGLFIEYLTAFINKKFPSIPLLLLVITQFSLSLLILFVIEMYISQDLAS